VLVKRLDDSLLKIRGSMAGCVELAEQSQRLASHSVLAQRQLSHLWCVQSLAQPGGLGVDAAAAAGFLSRARSWARVSCAAVAGSGAAARMARASGRMIPPRARAKAARKPGWYSRKWERSLLCPPVVLGIDETRRGKPKWIQDTQTGRWVRTERFETNFTDLSGTGRLLGQVAGRTGKAVTGWLDDRGQDWKNQVAYVAIDPCAVYRSPSPRRCRTRSSSSTTST
jgi:hypothetical protein